MEKIGAPVEKIGLAVEKIGQQSTGESVLLAVEKIGIFCELAAAVERFGQLVPPTVELEYSFTPPD